MLETLTFCCDRALASTPIDSWQVGCVVKNGGDKRGVERDWKLAGVVHGTGIAPGQPAIVTLLPGFQKGDGLPNAMVSVHLSSLPAGTGVVGSRSISDDQFLTRPLDTPPRRAVK